MNQNEMTVQLTAINDKLIEASVEIVAKIDELKAALENVEVPEEAAALIEAINQKASALADIVP